MKPESAGGNMNRVLSFLRGALLLGCILGLYFRVQAQIEREVLSGKISENKGDTAEVNALNLLYRLDRKIDPEKARKHLDDALILAQKIDYPAGQALALRSYGDFYNSRGEHDKAKAVLEKGKAIYEELKDAKGIISCLNGLGNVAIRQGKASLALEYYLTTARMNDEIGDDWGKASSYHNIGGIHYKQKRFDKALEYIGKGLKLKESLRDSSGMVTSLNAISVVYTAQQNFTKALEIQFHALKIARRVSDPYETALIINNIGVQYHYLEKLDSAEYFYRQALAINRKLDEKQELTIAYFNLGELSCLLNNGRQAVAYFDSSLSIAKQIGAEQLIAENYRGMANAHKVLGDYEKAYHWSEKHHALTDSLTGEKVKLRINDLQAKYESEQKDRSIAEWKKKEAEAVSIAERRSAFLIVIVTIVVAILVILPFYIGRRRAKERQRKVELEQKALRTQMNPHFIFNSLGAIQQMYLSGEMDLANNYMGDFGKLMRKILDNSGKDAISVKEELDMLKLYLDLEKERTSGRVEYEIVVDERIDQRGTFIPPMVIQPFVENAIWHGILPKKRTGKLLVALTLSDENGMLVCKVEDDGVGIGANPRKSGHSPKAMKITEQRLGTKLKIENLSPGTRISFEIPI